MADTKMRIRFFTIADFHEEEVWLREEHKNGWRLAKMIPPCFYFFEACEPEDTIYRLDYKNKKLDPDYLQMVQDYGWKYAGECFGWLYFRKSACMATAPNDGELFSDDVSRIEMLTKIMKTRLLPLLILFLCCVVPNSVRAAIGHEFGYGFTIFWAIMLVVYIYLLVHCGLKLRKLKQELE